MLGGCRGILVNEVSLRDNVLLTHGAGLDIHKQVILATVLTPTVTEARTFGTLTGDLLVWADWLAEWHVAHVAMKATGVNWKPIVNLFESYDFAAVWGEPASDQRHAWPQVQRTRFAMDRPFIAVGVLQGSYIPARSASCGNWSAIARVSSRRGPWKSTGPRRCSKGPM